jgi:hypothetical protein
MYRIDIDTQHDLVEVRLQGMMAVDEVRDYIAELKRQFIAHRLRSYVLLLDLRDFPIQTQEMLRAMGEHMVSMPKARAIAAVTGSSLARMQVRRLFTQAYARIAATIDEGRAWVLHGTEPTLT